MCDKEAYWRFEYRLELVSAGDTRARQLPPGWLQTEQEPFIYSNLFPRMYRRCIYHLNQAIDSGYASDLAENSFYAAHRLSRGTPGAGFLRTRCVHVPSFLDDQPQAGSKSNDVQVSL